VNQTKINNMTTEQKIWVVTMPSAYRFRNCLLGHGETKTEAMSDAFGPKPWPKSARNADCSEMTFDELEQLKHSMNDEEGNDGGFML
jgi:hypothetical protein